MTLDCIFEAVGKYKPCSVKRRLHEFVKSINPSQPAQHVRPDMGQNFSLSLIFFKFSACQRKGLPHESLDCLSKLILLLHNEVLSYLV